MKGEEKGQRKKERKGIKYIKNWELEKEEI